MQWRGSTNWLAALPPCVPQMAFRNRGAPLRCGAGGVDPLALTLKWITAILAPASAPHKRSGGARVCLHAKRRSESAGRNR